MVRKQTLFILSLIIAVLILMVNFYLSGQRALAIAALLPAGLMVYARRSLQPIMAHISLAGFTVLSAIGIMLNNTLMLMVLAMTATLASWDLVLEMHLEYPTTEKYERHHLQYLGIALGLGLLGASTIHWLYARLPFGVMLALAIIMLISLNQVLTYLKKMLEPSAKS